MRMVLTPEQLMKDLLNSESFDDLVAYRLKISLDSALMNLNNFSNMSELSGDDFQDFVDTLAYARALVKVLEWFTVDSYETMKLALNRFSNRLNSEF